MAWPSGSGSRPCSRTSSARLSPHTDDPPGDADHGRVVWHRVNHHRAGADLHVVADADVSQNLGARADDHVVAEGGVPLALLLAGAAQGHALVEQNVVADFGGLADHHAHAVVDEEPAADRRAGMDLDARQGAAELRNERGPETCSRIVYSLCASRWSRMAWKPG